MNRFLLIIAAILAFVGCATGSARAQRSGYQTLEGTLVLRGTGERSTLFFHAGEGKMYRVVGAQRDNLNGIRGISVTATGFLESQPEGSYSQGTFDVKLFNVNHRDSRGRQVVLGLLEREGNSLVLLTRDFQVVRIDSDTHHEGLASNVGKEVVVRGFRESSSTHDYAMRLSSYMVLR